jgi:uncharacterized protein
MSDQVCAETRVFPITFKRPAAEPIEKITANVAQLGTLQVIIKVSERCNLACQYCYYFFMGDDSFAGRDPIMRDSVYLEIPKFLYQAVTELHIKRLEIAFHGGEPTLQRLRDFDAFCAALREQLDSSVQLSMTIQTNGLHLPLEWLECLARQNVTLGISLDGPKEYNDKYRTDSKGRGSYEKIALNLKRARDYVGDNGKISPMSSISVMNYAFDAKIICHHLRDEFSIYTQSYLMPDRCHDHAWKAGETAEAYGRQFAQLFDLQLEDPTLKIRQVQDILDFFQQKKVSVDVAEFVNDDELYMRSKIMIIQSTGEISVDDSLIPALSWRQSSERWHIGKDTTADFVNSRTNKELMSLSGQLPDGCSSCKWKKLCNGGAMENRYHSTTGFNNPSVYCDGLKIFYEHVASTLNAHGYPSSLIEEKLGI